MSIQGEILLGVQKGSEKKPADRRGDSLPANPLTLVPPSIDVESVEQAP